jgi:hypothetical protein
MGNRRIVKPETFLGLPEVSSNHVFKIVNVDQCARVEGIWIVHLMSLLVMYHLCRRARLYAWRR